MAVHVRVAIVIARVVVQDIVNHQNHQQDKGDINEIYYRTNRYKRAWIL